MLQNYFKIAFRTILRKKVFSLVNIMGLSVGLASVLIISSYIMSEMSFDTFHKDADRTYRLLEHLQFNDAPERTSALVNGAIGKFSEDQVAGVTDYMRVMQLGAGGLNLKYKDKEFETPFLVSDHDFFTFFDFELASGIPSEVFRNPMSIVLSERESRKFFGEENPIGKTIVTRLNDDDYDLVVTGVMKDMPENSHLNFNMLLTFTTIDKFFKGFTSYYDSEWTLQSMLTYLKTEKTVDPKRITEGINQLAADNKPDEINWERRFSLQPLKDIHFGSADLEGDMNYREGDLNYLFIFGFVGLLILSIAFANYINLSTIKATDRIREIGLRRVVGANRKQLVLQFMMESVFVSVLSLGVAMTILQFCGPLVVMIFDNNLLSYIYQPEFLVGLVLVFVVLGLAAGLYPALAILKGKTVEALKNQVVGVKRQSFFKGVVLFQFIISLVMIVATLVVYNQLNYIENKDLGYDKEALALIEISSDQARDNQSLIISEFSRDADVLGVSVVSRVPAEWKSYYEVSIRDKQAKEFSGIPYIGVDESFLDVFNIGLKSGKNFGEGLVDSTKVLINETLARQLGIAEASGQAIELFGIRSGAQKMGLRENLNFEIMGIIDDFHFQSLREEIPPMIFVYKENPIQNIDYFVVKLRAQAMGQTMDRLKVAMQKFDPSPFGYNFLDDKLQRYYVEDNRRSNLFFIAASIAVFIAFIGLFALVHFALQKRLKEMSIRKVLGANVNSLIALLSRDYIKLLLIALVVAVPVSYLGMSNWLNDFVYRTQIQWWVFGLALSVCAMIAMITALTQIRKAARRNPADILRNE